MGGGGGILVKERFAHELQPIFPTQLNGHGFLVRDYSRDDTQVQEGPLRPLLRVPL